jgi:hypothetical protein
MEICASSILFLLIIENAGVACILAQFIAHFLQVELALLFLRQGVSQDLANFSHILTQP